jgi:hypothetical protein
MSDTLRDAERMAALIDGHLDAHARAELLADLDASPDTVSVLSDAIAVQSELSATRSPRSVAKTSWRRRGAWMTLAAAAIVAVATSVTRRVERPDMLSSVAIAATLPASAAGTVTRTSPWPARRGSNDALPPTARAVRVGAWLVDFALLLQSRDTGAAAVVGPLSSLLASVPAGNEARDAVAALGSAATPAQLRNAADLAEGMVGRREARVGAWLEGARLAASQQDSGFFHQPGTKIALRTLSAVAGERRVGEPAVNELIALLDSPAREWSPIGQAIVTLLKELGS